MKQHPHVKTLRAMVRTTEGFTLQEAISLSWAIAVCEAADNLINVKGRFHSENAYKHLEQAVNPE